MDLRPRLIDLSKRAYSDIEGKRKAAQVRSMGSGGRIMGRP